MAELRVFRSVLWLLYIFTLNCRRVVLEGDSSTVIIWMQDSAHPNLNSLLARLRHLASNLDIFKVEHAFRKANCPADCLVRRDINLDFMDRNILPLEVELLLMKDSMGFNYLQSPKFVLHLVL